MVLAVMHISTRSYRRNDQPATLVIIDRLDDSAIVTRHLAQEPTKELLDKMGNREWMLAASAYERFTDSGWGGTTAMIDGYTFPNSWYEGLVARAGGNIHTAQHAFQEAGRVVEIDLAQWPGYMKAIIILVLIHTALG